MSKGPKKRDCPAIGGPITPAECGEKRISVHACPADCRFNPFAPANYDQLLRIDDELEPKCLERLQADPRADAAIEQQLARVRRERSPHALSALLNFELYVRRGPDGRNLVETWECAGFPGLKNDHRIVLRGRAQMRVALLEVRRFLDLETVEVADLLAPGQPHLRLRDRRLVSSAVRFSTLLGWIYPLPHFWRAFGSAIDIPVTDAFDTTEMVTEIVRHLGGPADESAMRLWLAENFARFDDALLAVSVIWRRQMFAASDAMIGRAVYELRRPFAECLELLDQVPEVESDNLTEGERKEGFADARAWLDPSETETDRMGASTLGRVLLGQSYWRLETMGAVPLEEIRRRFEAQLGGRVRFTGQRLDDLAAAMAEKDPKIDESLVPPRLRERQCGFKLRVRRTPMPLHRKSPEEIASECLAENDREWLDGPVPALNGQTPRAAASDPALRPVLIRLMKTRVRSVDERNLRTGSSDDVNWMLQELGLEEIRFEPPPKRPIAEQPTEDDEVDAASDRGIPDSLDLPLPPPPPARPFTPDEVYESMRELLESQPTAQEAVHALEAEQNWFISELADFTEQLIDEDLFALLVPALIHAWRMFVPPGTCGPLLDLDRLRATMEHEVEQLVQAIETSKHRDFEGYLNCGPQPALAAILGNLVLTTVEALPRKDQPEANKVSMALIFLRAVIQEIDTACRG